LIPLPSLETGKRNRLGVIADRFGLTLGKSQVSERSAQPAQTPAKSPVNSHAKAILIQNSF
jgi:hypothetical protein